MKKEILVMDTECYQNYWSIGFKSVEKGTSKVFRYTADEPLNRDSVRKILKSYTIVSFNGISYDTPMITAALCGWDNERLKAFSDKLISDGRPAWQIVRDADMEAVNFDHIDLINVAKGVASLKIYGGRLHCKRMQDLPFEHTRVLSSGDMVALEQYLINDLDTTIELYNHLRADVTLREEMSAEYGLDLRSKSDAQIAEAVIRKEIQGITGKKVSAPALPRNYSFRYKNPGVIEFKGTRLQEVFGRILSHNFTLSDAGNPVMPEWLKKTKVEIGGRKYSMGIGGLHSNEKSQYVVRGPEEVIADWDVTSYYPSIILQQAVYPKQLGPVFLKIFQVLADKRVAAKKAGDNRTAGTLKIVVNGIYGKLGSKYSIMYSPDLMLQTTLTGQLALLMLIERLVDAGIEVISANTDGIVTRYHRDRETVAQQVVWHWMLDTSYTLERADYDMLASLDVNGYLALKPDGKIKGKKNFACLESRGGAIAMRTALDKNPDRTIVARAVAEFLVNGVPVEETITSCQDVREFVTIRQVAGGAVWRDQVLGKAVRMYYSTDVDALEALHYAKNGNKVPNSAGCRPLMELPDTVPADIDYQRYIEDAQAMVRNVGYRK